jgi:PAS domain S-box-containing protein
MPAATGDLPHAAAILDSAPVGYCLLDQDGCVSYVNAAFADSLALSPEAMRGEHIFVSYTEMMSPYSARQ